MFYLLLNSGCTASRPSLVLSLCLQWLDWGCTIGWKGTQPRRCPELTREIFHTILVPCSAIKEKGGSFSREADAQPVQL